MIATTIEQSKHLLELGLDPKTADMYYTPLNMEYPWVWEGKPLLEKGAIPAWSLSALLEVIPKECEPDIQKSPISGVYFAHCFANGKPYITDDHGNAVCAAYEIVCWLLEQGLIKKGGQEMKRFLKHLFCKHDYHFVRNLHGDEVILHGWKRSVWRCSKCGKARYENWYVAYKKEDKK